MQIEHDPGEGTAYIYLNGYDNKWGRNEIFEGKYGTVILDFDTDDNVIGVEVLG